MFRLRSAWGGVALLTVGLAACGGGGGSAGRTTGVNATATSSAGSAVTSSSASGSSGDQCGGVYSAQEATAALGVTVTQDTTPALATALFKCVYRTALTADPNAFVEISVFQGGSTQEDAVAGVGNPGIHVEPITGLGPHAFTSDIGVIAQIDANRFMTVASAVISNGAIDKVADAARSLAIARIVYTRLGGH